MGLKVNRRDFLGQVAKGGAVVAITPGLKLAGARAIGANDRIRLGIIGAGARGQEDLKNAIALPNVECVAMADV